MSEDVLRVQLPYKLGFLVMPARYKVAYGGRGSAKSWSFARQLLVAGYSERLRILCAREVQKTIKDSVHKLLKDQIEALGLQDFYQVLETEIRGANGTEFLFAGLSNLTATSIKSFEGVDRCWVEEAQTVTAKSWGILIPTIRKEGSEIWVTYNPDLETDATHRMFVLTPPPDCISVHMNYCDNPWFPQVLEDERLHAQATMEEADYLNIWEGICRPAAAGAIYASEVARASVERRIERIPYDPALKVHTIWDMGFGDNMAMIMCQRARTEVRVVDYIQVRQHRLDECVRLLRTRPYNWGYDFLPHDGEHHERKTGLSDEEILKKLGRRVLITPNIPIEDGIRNARNQFYVFAFDNKNLADEPNRKEGVWHLLECLKRYRRAETKHGGDGRPVHDEFSDGADAFRYTCLNINKMTNEDPGDVIRRMPVAAFKPINSEMGY